LPFYERCVIIFPVCDSINEGVWALLTSYVFIGIFAIIAILFPIIALALAFVIRPKKPNPVKSSTYECGLETIGETWVQFRVQYYIYALVFVIFDIETVFLFPWAVAYNKLGLFALIEMFIFLAILAGGLIYAWRKGALEWV
jgi:NADH-quinone oxidoreductase subunit A